MTPRLDVAAQCKFFALRSEMKLPQIESESFVCLRVTVLRSTHFTAKVIVADVGVADCSKALALKARF
jgi:hypothetical protein